MTVYWVRFTGESALNAMEAVERALRSGDTDAPPAEDTASAPPALVFTEPPTPVDRDVYLGENLAALRAGWSVDAAQVAAFGPARLSGLITLIQRAIRRGTWWYTVPQWLQVNQFHASLVRVVDSLVEYHRQTQRRQQQMEGEIVYLQQRVRSLEQQIQVSRSEYMQFQRQVLEVERLLGERKTRNEVQS